MLTFSLSYYWLLKLTIPLAMPTDGYAVQRCDDVLRVLLNRVSVFSIHSVQL